MQYKLSLFGLTLLASSIVHAWIWDSMFIPEIDDKSPTNSYLSCSKVSIEGKRNFEDYELNIVVDKRNKTIRIGSIIFPAVRNLSDAEWIKEDGFISHFTWYTTFKVLEDSSEYRWNLDSLMRDKYYIWSIKSDEKYPKPFISDSSVYSVRSNSNWILDRIGLQLRYYPRISSRNWGMYESWNCNLLEDHKDYRKYLLNTYHSETEKFNIRSIKWEEEKKQKEEQERLKNDQIDRAKKERKKKEKI